MSSERVPRRRRQPASPLRHFSFYDPATGMFSPKKYSGPADSIGRNTPAGMVAIEGEYDHLSQRVDLETGDVIDYRPPAPDADHEWNAERRRWVLKAEVAERRSLQAAALARIEELERAQLRPLRELQLDPSNSEAKRRLETIEAEIAALRPGLVAATSGK